MLERTEVVLVLKPKRAFYFAKPYQVLACIQELLPNANQCAKLKATVCGVSNVVLVVVHFVVNIVVL